MAASGRKRTLDFTRFRASERPLSGKGDIQGTAQNFHQIDQLGTSAFRPEADIKLELVQRSANDRKATFAYFSALSNMTHDFGTIIGWIAIE